MHLEDIFDTNELIFRYNEKTNSFSLLKADFVLLTPVNERDTYVFLSNEKESRYFCRSLFYKDHFDYTRGQTKYTLLYKEKINLATGQGDVQYNRIKTHPEI